MEQFVLNPGFAWHEEELDAGDVAVTSAREIRIKKVEMMRVAREANLARVFPAKLEEGFSYHIISSGDIDALSYLSVLLERNGPFDHLYASTWTMSREDVRLLARYLEEGAIGKLIQFTGEYFASRETSVYAQLIEMIAQHPGSRVRLFRNHCKLLVAAHTETGFYVTCEGSANFTTNPRTEQTTITVSRSLHDFYVNWFDELLARDDRAA